MRDFALIFRHAWELARKGAEMFGGSARDYFRESLLLAYNQLKRNVTAKDLVKIMTGRYMSMSQIREEVNAKFKKQTAKNIARRIWNMFRSPYVEIEKIKCESTGKYLYHLKHAQKKLLCEWGNYSRPEISTARKEEGYKTASSNVKGRN